MERFMLKRGIGIIIKKYVGDLAQFTRKEAQRVWLLCDSTQAKRIT
jgi:hypothetical protein